MSEIDMTKTIADLKRLASEAQARSLTDSAAQAMSVNGANGGNQTHATFSSLLQNAINAVNDAQTHSDKLKTAFEVGDPSVDLPQVMVASQKASVAFTAMLEVRNQLVKAYQDVMNIPI
jgi:flagellar hook-basal body complex protein FliE